MAVDGYPALKDLAPDALRPIHPFLPRTDFGDFRRAHLWIRISAKSNIND
jgi:hypothetical protein